VEVAERLGISRQLVHKLAQSGRLNAVRDGKAMFYTEASVRALEEERKSDS
jgi:excisionase family DNA binding protein